MNPKKSIALAVSALSLAVSVMAGPPPTFFTTAKATAKTAAATEASADAQKNAEVAAALAPKVYQVMRGSPKSPFSGLTYVTASGHELSKSRDVAMAMVGESPMRAMAKVEDAAATKTGN
jgi:hypothetical protein